MESLMLEDSFGHELHVVIAMPKESPKGIIQIVHGAGEHILRYKELMTYLKNENFMVIGHDQLGHGKTSHEDKTHFADYDGDVLLMDGVKVVRDYARMHYPQIPLFGIGHSMGSFVVRALMAKEKDLYDGVILTGSPYVGKSKIALAKFLGKWIRRFKGPKHISPYFTKLIQDAPYRSMHKNGLVNARHEWTTSDLQKQHEFLEDPLTGKPFSVAAQLDVLNLIQKAHDFTATKHHASSQLIALYCGDEDAMCDYGEDIKKLYNFYLKAGYTNVNYRVYANARHELHNEVIRPKVMHDIVKCLNEQITV